MELESDDVEIKGSVFLYFILVLIDCGLSMGVIMSIMSGNWSSRSTLMLISFVVLSLFLGVVIYRVNKNGKKAKEVQE